MLKEAEIIEQQMMAARSQSSSGPQPDYSAQWADYYRQNSPLNFRQFFSIKATKYFVDFLLLLEEAFLKQRAIVWAFLISTKCMYC